MPRLFVPKEGADEPRVALVPADVKRLTTLGFQIYFEEGAGVRAYHEDEEYLEAGAVRVRSDELEQNLGEADVVVRIQKPDLREIEPLKKDALHLSYLDPFNDKERLDALARRGVKAVSLEMIPRTTIAQKMDVLSSQTSLAGYYAVVMAAAKFPYLFPMMMTPSGNISPVRVFILGVGVAGLQAIATAKRLGARVEAYDTRPAVEEQVKSLGARFLKIDLGTKEGEAPSGYAKALTPEQIQRQREAQTKVLKKSDIVITTAKVFGRQAPLLITKEMLDQMQKGSLVIDMAVASGGNVEGSDPTREVVTDRGVRIIGGDQLERHLAVDASAMFSGNIRAFLEHFFNEEERCLELSPTEKTLKECLMTAGGMICHPRFKKEEA